MVGELGVEPSPFASEATVLETVRAAAHRSPSKNVTFNYTRKVGSNEPTSHDAKSTASVSYVLTVFVYPVGTLWIPTREPVGIFLTSIM